MAAARKQRPRPGGRAGDARAAALWLLHEVLERRRPLDDALAQALAGDGRMAALSARDRAFARLLTGTVLRRLGQLDDAIARCLDRPLNRRGAAARDPLRLAAAQLMFLDTPPHAAVDAAVRQVARTPGLKGLVNAVARRLAREGADIAAAQDAERLNCPDWLWQSWSAAYGEPATRSMVAVLLADPPLDLSLRDAGEADAWAERLEAELLPTGTLRRRGGGAVATLPGYDEGAWWVQDAAAALPVRLLPALAGQRVIDLCAAPGGKTAQLAAAGARVTAVDISSGRLQRVAENLARLRLAAETVAADATSWQPPAPADAVLLDAPCTSTGTIRRHPDVWRLKQPDDVAAVTGLQDRLLAAAAAMLRPGGTLVYCVCSLQPEEGPARIDRLLAGGAPLRRQPLRPAELAGLGELIDDAGDLRTLPHQLGGMDGFFACRLQRQGG